MIPLDHEIRQTVYQHFVDTGRAPSRGEIAKSTSYSPDEIRASLMRMAEERVLVLQQDSGELLMAMPFSAVPTAFETKIGERTYWANCAWDALGIAAMLKQDARVMTSCADCGEALQLEVQDNALAHKGGEVVYFGVPAKQWWDDIVFT
jgi:hypothetical protein